MPYESSAKKNSDLRVKAEQIVSSKMKGVIHQSTGNMERIVQELSVHQIELEMQNEELCKTRDDLQESRQKFVDLYPDQ